MMPAHVIKVCGITSAADAHQAIEAGATALGFNFWKGSPRYIEVAKSRWIADLGNEALKVGVFVDEAPERVREVVEALGLDVAQIHRGVTPEGISAWRAVAFGETVSGAIPVLVDAPPVNGMPGGTGKTYDWARVAGLSQLSGRLIVAGGLDGSNVREAIRQARPWGVDACSRLESAPGKKDHDKVRAFVEAAREEFERKQ